MLAPFLLLVLTASAWMAWRELPWPATVDGQGETRRVARPGVFYGPSNSLAVLPFSDRSPDQDEAALAFGFGADLLDRLAQLPGLRVTSRNSVFYFRDPAVPRRVVAERLQTRFLLQGYWIAEEDGLRVNLAMYDALRDSEVWREEFSSRRSDWPGLREQAAAAVLQQLPVDAPALPPSPAEPFAAWAAWAEAQYLLDPLGPGDLAAGAAALDRALELDPLAARPRLALAELWLHPGFPAVAGEDPIERARAEVLSVLQRGPGNPAALALLSHIRRVYDWDWVAAAEDGRAAVAAGGDAQAFTVAGLAELAVGQAQAAVANLESAVQRDPLNLGTRLSLGLAQEFAGDYDAALSTYRQLLALRPEYPAARAFRARVKALQGKGATARREADQETDPFWRRYAQILALTAMAGDDPQPPADAAVLLKQMIDEDGAVAAFQVAELMALGGDLDAAFEWLQRAVTQRDGGIGSLLSDPLLRGLHDDPRWQSLLESLGLPLDSDSRSATVDARFEVRP